MEHIVRDGVDLTLIIATLIGVIINTAYLIKNKRRGKVRYTAFVFSAICLWTTLFGGIVIVLIGDDPVPSIIRLMMELGGVFGATSLIMQAILDY